MYFLMFFIFMVLGEWVFGWFKLIYYELWVICFWSLFIGVLGYWLVCRVNSFDCRLLMCCCNFVFFIKNLFLFLWNWCFSLCICLWWFIFFFFDESVVEYKNLYVIEDVDNNLLFKSRIVFWKLCFNRNFYK